MAKQSIWENVKGLLSVIVIFLFVRTFIIEAYRIPSGSMKPALQIGDWLFVNKMTYGPHVPFTDFSLPGYREPQRGDIVVFQSPYQGDEAARGNDPTPTLVKRLVGVAGDTLYMRNRLLYRNGDPQNETHVMPNPYGQDSYDPLFEWQRAVGLQESRFGSAPERPTHDNWGPIVVPSGHLFMMGDNRYDSKDSRYWGFVPRENVRGRPMFVYYSYNAEDSDRPLPFFSDIRWSRIGHWIR
jgi:signal peptidase I